MKKLKQKLILAVFGIVFTAVCFQNLGIPKEEEAIQSEIAEEKIKGSKKLLLQQILKLADSALEDKTVKSILESVKAEERRLMEEDTAWKLAYIHYIKDSVGNSNVYFNLDFLDEDNIPELMKIKVNTGAPGCKILSYTKGQVKEIQSELINFSYIAKKNLIHIRDFRDTASFNSIYSISDGKLTLIAEGQYREDSNKKNELDGEGKFIYEYEWNGVTMKKEEYEAALNAVFDISKEKPSLYHRLYAQEMIDNLEKSLGKTGHVPAVISRTAMSKSFLENHYRSWSEDKKEQKIKEREQYYRISGYYNEIMDYWEKTGQVREDRNVMEPLFYTDMKYYTKFEWENLSPIVIHLAKNEIYARHGYIFKDEDLNNYFMGCIWYEPTCKSTDFDDSVFNEFEKENLRYLIELSD